MDEIITLNVVIDKRARTVVVTSTYTIDGNVDGEPQALTGYDAAEILDGAAQLAAIAAAIQALPV